MIYVFVWIGVRKLNEDITLIQILTHEIEVEFSFRTCWANAWKG